MRRPDRVQGVAQALVASTEVPALLTAAMVHAELLTAAPFASHNGIVARAAERLVLAARGVDEKSLVVPEAGHLANRAAYESNLEGYADGGRAGVHAWALYAAEAFAAGAEASPLRAELTVVEVRGAPATSLETTDSDRGRVLVASPGFDTPVATSQARSRGHSTSSDPRRCARSSRHDCPVNVQVAPELSQESRVPPLTREPMATRRASHFAAPGSSRCASSLRKGGSPRGYPDHVLLLEL